MTYKYCIVPKCTNTSVKTPEKLFFQVPRDPQIRKKWCVVMKREIIQLSSKSNRHCCEDHFDLEDDMENYIKFKLVGGKLSLKKGVLPHKFDCQKPSTKNIERPGFKKRQDIEYIERVLSPNIGHENLLTEPVEFQECGTSEEQCSDPLFVPMSDPLFVPINEDKVSKPKTGQKNKGVQVNIKEKMKSKSTNTPKRRNKKKVTCFQETNCEESFTDSYSIATTNSFKSTAVDDLSTDLAVTKTMNENLFKEHMKKGALIAVSRDPELLIGIPKHSQFCLEHLQNVTRLRLLEIIVPLRKIRWREPNSMLAIQYGLSESSVCKYFNNAVPKIATCMKELVIFPSADDVRHNLPIPFRQRYSKVTSIIDCFEVQIEKPSDATHQALTWSQCKSCNTIKYLISITPDGLINFISEGYGGRTPDSTIFEDCGFLDKLSKESLVLANRDFKNISHLLEQRGCKLVTPPSVNSNSKHTKEDVLQTKRIAALRVHVERSIGKLRHFEMIGPHATVDISYTHFVDDVVVIACGIVNLQNCLFNHQI